MAPASQEPSPSPNPRSLQENQATHEHKLVKDQPHTESPTMAPEPDSTPPPASQEPTFPPPTTKELQENQVTHECKHAKDQAHTDTPTMAPEPVPKPAQASQEPTSPSPTAKYLQENELTHECKHLLPSLPKDKGWVCTHLFQYQGFWHTVRQLQGVLATQSHFRALPSDTLLITTPKSGTTWLKALLFGVVNRHRHPPTTRHPLTTHNPHDLVPFLELNLYADNRLPDVSELPSPRLFASHLPAPSLPPSVWASGCKIIYLCRDPKDTFISLWHFTNRLRPVADGVLPLEEALGRFCRGVSLYGPFWDHVLGYWKESHERPSELLFLRYEEVKGDPVGSVKRLAEFLGCGFSAAEEEGGAAEEILRLCSFESLSKMEVNRSGKLDSGEEKKAFFRRGEVGDWKNYLTPEMIERLEKVGEQKLHGSGLKF